MLEHYSHVRVEAKREALDALDALDARREAKFEEISVNRGRREGLPHNLRHIC